jgi:hypothetical protein
MREGYQQASPCRPCWRRRPALRGRETHLPILLDEVGRMMVVRFGDPGLQVVHNTMRTFCRLRTGINVGVEEDAIFVDAILELEGHDSIVCERIRGGRRPRIGCKTHGLTGVSNEGAAQYTKIRRTVVPVLSDYPLFFEHNHAVRTF